MPEPHHSHASHSSHSSHSFSFRIPRSAFRILIPLALLLAAAWPLACATVITPPARPADPVNVFLVDHGRTSSLVLPTPEGGLIRYSFGNWEWYALQRQTFWRGFRALAWPSQGALGHHRYPGPPELAHVQKIFAGWNEAIYAIPVSRARALALERALDERWSRKASTLHINKEYALEFVKDDQAYYIFNVSNKEIAGWLRQLGCKVRGPTLWAWWNVK